MKKLYEGQKHSLYYIQKELKLDIKRLYRYADGTNSVEKMPASLLNDIAKIEGISIDELYIKMKEYQSIIKDFNEVTEKYENKVKSRHKK